MDAAQFIRDYLGPKPGLPGNLDAGAWQRANLTGGQQRVGSEMGALQGVANQLTGQQMGAIGQIAGGLNNAFTQQAQNALGASLGDAGRAGALGQSLANESAAGFASSGPTAMEQALYRQGQADLALGRSLSPEQQRQATQSARQAFAGRGLGTGMAAAASEILNRDRFATEREAQRRQFAASANQMREQNMMNRRQAAGQLGGLAGGLFTDAAGVRQRGAALSVDIDPFSRALQPGLSMGQTAQAAGLDTIGRAYDSVQDFYGNAATFNINRGDSLYNAWLNAATAAQTGQMAANAQTNAANAQAAATRASRPTFWQSALGAVGRIFSDERMKKDIKPVGRNGVLGLTAYEYRYKGDPKKAPKRIGYMAQDVAEVLPEAVEEVNYKGKKRLAIKPAVIGAALAEELAAQAA